MNTLAGETVDIIHDSKKTADVFQSSEKHKKIVAKVCLAVKLWSQAKTTMFGLLSLDKYVSFMRICDCCIFCTLPRFPQSVHIA